MQTFDPSNLRYGFEQLLQKNEYRKNIENDINDILKNKSRLDNDPNFIGAIEKLGELIASRSYYRRRPAERFREEFNKRIKLSRSDFFKTKEGQEILTDIVRETATMKDDAVREIQNLLAKLNSQSIKGWTEHLYALSKKGKTEVLGEKGRDNYLRDMGYFDRVPIDVHEMRFVIRTGIYHCCSRDMFDPLKKGDLQNALVNFCNRFLSGLEVSDVDLSKSPGIVDLIIWYHCADPPLGFSICAAKPRCLEDKATCPFSDACFFSIQR